MLALLVALSLTADAPECQADAECVLKVRCSRCECCPEEEAMSRAAASRDQLDCARLGPCSPADCDRSTCPRVAPSKAVCRAGQCKKARAR